jgi:hypothetical protein
LNEGALAMTRMSMKEGSNLTEEMAQTGNRSALIAMADANMKNALEEPLDGLAAGPSLPKRTSRSSVQFR